MHTLVCPADASGILSYTNFMTNEKIPPSGEVKHPASETINPALQQAARSLHHCRLPAQAETLIAQAVEELEKLLYCEGVMPGSSSSDAMLLKQSAVLDNLFHNMIASALTPGNPVAENRICLALRSQKLCSNIIEGIHKRRQANKRIL